MFTNTKEKRVVESDRSFQNFIATTNLSDPEKIIESVITLLKLLLDCKSYEINRKKSVSCGL